MGTLRTHASDRAEDPALPEPGSQVECGLLIAVGQGEIRAIPDAVILGGLRSGVVQATARVGGEVGHDCQTLQELCRIICG